MSEKMKCARCGKRFKQSNKKQVFCADCLAKERTAKKSGAQLIPSSAGYTTSGALRRPEVGAQSPAITIVTTTPPPELGAYGARARIAERHMPPHTPERSERAEQPSRSAATTPVQQPVAVAPPPAVAPRQQPPKGAVAQPEKRIRQPRPAAPPFQLTDEVRTAIEQRYLELAQPVEFDGIRTQIAGELQTPKPIVKQVIRDLRANRQLPSWWELQAYKGNHDDLARVRERYLPLLPVPPVGVHKQIADELQMDAPQVYQAIRRLRAEMKLPQYNPPETHATETPPQDEANTAIDAHAADNTAANPTGAASQE